MSYVILWLAHLAWGLLLVAVVVALASRCKKPRWRKFWPILAAIIIFFTFAAAATVGAFLLSFNVQPKWLFWCGLTHTIAYTIGTIIILKRGLKSIHSESQVGHSWPRARLAVAFGSLLFIYFVTLNLMDTRIMMDVSNMRVEATSKIIELMPPLLPGAFNAYPVYEQSAKALDTRDGLPTWFSDSTEPDFYPAFDEVTNFLKKNESILATVRRAASMPDCSRQVYVTDFIASPIPYFSHYRTLARLLSISARCKALDKDLPGALRELAVIEAMAEHLQGFPDLIPCMIAASLHRMRVEVLECVLASIDNHPEGAIALPVNTHPLTAGGFARTLSLELKGILQLFRTYAIYPESVGPDYVQEFAPSSGPVLAILRQLWRVFVLPSELDFARDMDSHFNGELAESYQALHEDLKEIEEAKASGEMGPLMQWAWGYFDFTAYMLRAMQCDAHRGLSDLALAATAFKAANGRYPDNLGDLVPDYIDRIPTDPFDSKALKMKPLYGGLDLYSVGPDPELESGKLKGSIHFYLGQNAYEKYRIKPAQEERKKAPKKRVKR